MKTHLRGLLNREIAWYQVLGVLGCGAIQGSLPAEAECPLCGGRLRVFKDSTRGGGWHYCGSCGSTGDMLELASAVWGTPPAETLSRLEAEGVAVPENAGSPDELTAYQANQLRLREEAASLVKRASERLASGSMAAGLANKFRVRGGCDPRLWLSRMGRFAGAATRDEVDRVFVSWLDEGEHARGAARCFVGKGWGELLILPFHDLPGRLSGFLCVGRDGERGKDWVFRARDFASHRGEGRVETGVAMHDVLLGPTDRTDLFGDRVFVLDDPLMALRLQARHLRDHERPLPLLGVHLGESVRPVRKVSRRLTAYSTWDAHPGREFVFCGGELTPELANMASRCGGRISASPRLANAPTDMSPLAWLKLFSRSSRPWRLGLERWLAGCDEGRVAEVLARLDLPDADMADFLRTCGRDAKLVVEAAIARETPVRRAATAKGVVYATQDGWFREKGEHRITDAMLRIDQVLCRVEDGEVFYSGAVLHQGREHAFTAPADVVDRGGFRWLRLQVLAAGGEVPVFDSAWSSQMVNIALQLHKPETITTASRFGWSDDESAFVLPRFRLGHRGDVVEKTTPLLDDLAPGRDLPPPGGVDPGDPKWLTVDAPTNRIYWATAAAIAANVVAPAANAPIAAIGLVGDGARVVGRLVAKALGCRELRWADAKTKCREEAADEALARHAWPLVLAVPRGAAADVSSWLQRESARNLIYGVAEREGDALAVQSRWRLVACDEPLTASHAAASHGGAVFVEWLRDFCRRGLSPESDREPRAAALLDDMAAWVDGRGDADLVRSAASMLDDAPTSVDQARRFVRLVYQYVASGAMVACREGFEEDGAGVLELPATARRPDGVFVSRPALAAALSDDGAPVPDPAKITRVLAEAGSLRREMLYNDQRGWLIDADWWRREIDAGRRYLESVLKVIR